MSQDEREREFEYAGPDGEDEDVFMEKEQPRRHPGKRSVRPRKMSRIYFLIVPAVVFILIGAGYCFLLVSANNVPSFAEMSSKQPSVPAMSKKGTPVIIQEGLVSPRAERPAREHFSESQEENRERAPVAQRSIAPISYADEAFKKEYLSILTKLSENTALIAVALKGELPEPDPALVSSIEEMTKDMRQLTEENADLRKKNEELTAEIEKLKAASIKNTVRKPPATDNTLSKGAGKSAANTRTDSGIAGWRIIGLSANRVVIRDRSGKIHNLGVGDKLGNITIQAVDLKSGQISTSAGQLAYGAAR